jgi:hypothetical protein
VPSVPEGVRVVKLPENLGAAGTPQYTKLFLDDEWAVQEGRA